MMWVEQMKGMVRAFFFFQLNQKEQDPSTAVTLIYQSE